MRRRVAAGARRGILAAMSVAGTAVAAPAPRGGARVAIGSAAVFAGAALVVAAVALPWATLLHGRLTVYGVQGDGAYLGAAALGVGALWAAYLRRGRPRPLRTVAAVAALVVLYWVLFDIQHMVQMVIDDPRASVMGWPLMRQGPLVAAGGAALLLAGTLLVPPRTPGVDWEQRLGVALAAVLLAAGAVHLRQVPDLLDESRLRALAAAGAAAALLALGAACAVVRRSRLLWGVAGAAAAAAALALVLRV
jgi:hypothetical protein